MDDIQCSFELFMISNFPSIYIDLYQKNKIFGPPNHTIKRFFMVNVKLTLRL